MKKIVILEENELEELTKGISITRAILFQILNSMDKNMQDDTMGIHVGNVSNLYSQLESAKITMDNINKIFEQL